MATKTEEKTRSDTTTDKKPKPKILPPYNVILLNDNDHTPEYVIEMLSKIFGHQKERGYKMAVSVHTQGRVVVSTTHKEQAELKQDQIHAFGADWRIPTCAGSMSSVIEPAETDSNDGHD